MGQIYALCGPSGVGKTTFLNTLFAANNSDLNLLLRSTTRKIRPNEKEGVDYNYYSHQGFLQKVFANDFLHVEMYDTHLFGIDIKSIDESLQSKKDAIIMAGIYGAIHLKDIYKDKVTIVYMYSGRRQTLYNPDCLLGITPEIEEIVRRLNEKAQNGIVEVHKKDLSSYIERRMYLNYIDLAFVNGKIRSNLKIYILENHKDRMDYTLAQFINLRNKKQIDKETKTFNNHQKLSHQADKEQIEQWKEMISEGKVKNALSEMYNFINIQEIKDDILIQKSRLNHILEKSRVGSLSFEEERLIIDRITKSAIEIINLIEHPPPQ